MDIVYEEGLRGHSVIDANGRVLGSLDGLAIDPQSWRVRALKVKLDRGVADAIGQSHRVFRAAIVDVPVEYVTGVGDTIVLDRAVETFVGQSETSAPVQ